MLVRFNVCLFVFLVNYRPVARERGQFQPNVVNSGRILVAVCAREWVRLCLLARRWSGKWSRYQDGLNDLWIDDFLDVCVRLQVSCLLFDHEATDLLPVFQICMRSQRNRGTVGKKCYAAEGVCESE